MERVMNHLSGEAVRNNHIALQNARQRYNGKKQRISKIYEQIVKYLRTTEGSVESLM